jgi:hypothetical protein
VELHPNSPKSLRRPIEPAHLQQPDCRLAASSEPQTRLRGGRFVLEAIMSSATYRLTQIHSSLDDAIAREMRKRLPDSLKLLRLKKLRLAVKDRLAAMMRKHKSR